MSEPFLRLDAITKAYPGVQALKGVSFEIGAGEVVGLIGENGAGKSTLMKVLGGVVAPTSGSIVIDGVVHPSLTVTQSLAAGIAFVHQELNLFDNLDAAANIFIGREPRWGGPLRLIDQKALHLSVAPLLKRLGCDFKPDTSVADLSIAQRQMLEITKALSLEARVIIMDEPTSSLTLAETDRLLAVIADLKASGVAIIFISHRLNEVERSADRVVVLRDGEVVGRLARDEIHHDRMIRLMIGRDLQNVYIPPKRPPGDAALELEDVETTAYPGRKVRLKVRHGEILGLGGLMGAGRTEIARALFGINKLAGGAIRINGEPATISRPRDAIAHGVYLVPEDRKAFGLILDDPIVSNISLPNLLAYASATLINYGAERRAAEQQASGLRIKAPDVETLVSAMSGGNQQKVVLGKWLAMDPKVILFDEPTRGVDVGSKAEIYALMRGLADRGVAILMISSDMEEVIGVSDRVAVMHEGAVAGVLERQQMTENSIMSLAVGKGLQ
jgi:ribose transport system ATP-binding protein